jgi:hypothetical protein
MSATRSPVRTTHPLCGFLLAAVAAAAQGQNAPPASAPAVKAGSQAAKTPAAAARAALDLRAPPLSHIYPSRELQYILAPDDSGADSASEVHVKGTKQAVVVPGAPGNQLLAVPWAILHPTQAWRIFTPLLEP